MREGKGLGTRNLRCDGHGPGRRAAKQPLTGQDTMAGGAARAAFVVGTCVVHDVCDREGLTRPALRRLALSLTASERPALRSWAARYLRSDPPRADELPPGMRPGLGAQRTPVTYDHASEGLIDLDPASVTEAGEEEDRAV
jgi:hypothetical protein